MLGRRLRAAGGGGRRPGQQRRRRPGGGPPPAPPGCPGPDRRGRDHATPSGPADLVIDAAYGTGFRGEYRSPVLAPGTPVLAVDIPSGVQGDTGAACRRPVAARPHGHLRGPQARPPPGRRGPAWPAGCRWPTSASPPGSPAISVMEDADVAALLPPPSPRRQQVVGAVLVVAGSPGMTGAAALCARSAYRAGAGMVRLGVPGSELSDAPATEAVSVPLPAEGGRPRPWRPRSRCAAVVVGPGLGRDAVTAAEVRRLVAESPVPVVVDADGLFALGTGRRRRLPAGPVAGGAHPPRRRVRPADGGRPRARPDRRRPAAWPRPRARWRCSRDRPRRWPTRSAGCCSACPAPRRWPPPAPATSCPG